MTAASLAPVTQRIKLLVALRTSLGTACGQRAPGRHARSSAEGRLLLNVVPGGDATELAADGIHLAHDERYANADEFLTIWRRLLFWRDGGLCR